MRCSWQHLDSLRMPNTPACKHQLQCHTTILQHCCRQEQRCAICNVCIMIPQSDIPRNSTKVTDMSEHLNGAQPLEEPCKAVIVSYQLYLLRRKRKLPGGKHSTPAFTKNSTLSIVTHKQRQQMQQSIAAFTPTLLRTHQHSCNSATLVQRSATALHSMCGATRSKSNSKLE
jgi:hypothetical protein